MNSVTWGRSGIFSGLSGCPEHWKTGMVHTAPAIAACMISHGSSCTA